VQPGPAGGSPGRPAQALRGTLLVEVPRAYESQLKAFTQWCAEKGLDALGASDEEALQYLHARATGAWRPNGARTPSLSAASLRLACSAINAMPGRPPLPRQVTKVLRTWQARGMVRAPRARPEGGHEGQALPLTLRTWTRLAEAAVAAGSRPGWQMAAGIATAYTAALRIGELLGLRWRDVQLEHPEGAHLTLYREKAAGARTTSSRVLPLYDAHAAVGAVRLLRRLQRREARHGRGDPDGFIFADTRGRPWTHRRFNEELRRLGRELGLRGATSLSSHGLRSGWASDMRAGGAPAALVRRTGRWSDETLVDMYDRVPVREDAESIQEVLRRVAGRGASQPMPSSLQWGGGAVRARRRD
jgi:integrase